MPTLKRMLSDIRDLLRTDLAPDTLGYTESEWAQVKMDRASGLLDSIVQDLQAKEDRRKLSSEEKLKLRLAKKQLALRNTHRGTTCVGCPDNRYNFQSGGSTWEAPTTGEGCYHLKGINRGVCPLKYYKTGGRLR